MLVSFSANAAVQLDKIKLPPGFKISVWAKDLGEARSMTWGENKTLFFGTRRAGKVFAITSDKKLHQIARGLNMPNGVAFKDGNLYVAEVSKVTRYDKAEERLSQVSPPAVVNSNFPDETHHGWKFIAFGPDGKLYVPVGAPCNVCEKPDPFSSIMRMNADGTNLEVFARGVRNTVGFDWHPTTKELWFTDNGRDMMGDNMPADELNRAPKIGMHFGFPFCHQGDTLNPNHGTGKNCSDYIAPEQKLGPHVAALGMRFYTGSMFPAEYKNQIFIAEHGSWNRSTPIGYRVMVAKLGPDGKVVSYKVFAEGWLQEGQSWGRPVDVIQAHDGSLLVSDDQAGVIYQITYSGNP